MRSSLPKVLHPVCGRPMVAWPVLAAREAGAGRVVRDRLARPRPLRRACPRAPRPSSSPSPTAPAARSAPRSTLIRDSETVVVLSGDHPLITAEIDRGAARRPPRGRRRGDGDDASSSTTPARYGRIVRDADGDVERIVETKDPEGVAARGARDPRDQHRHLRLRRRAAGRGARPASRNDNAAGRVLPRRRAAAAARGRASASSPTRSTTSSVNIGVNNRADLAAVERRGPPPDPRAPHARRRDDRRPRLDLDRRRRRDRAPTPRSSPAPRCAARTRVGARQRRRPAHDPDRLDARRRGRRSRTPTSSSARSPTAARSARSPTCARAPTLARGRQGRHLRRDQELARSARAPRSRTSSYVGDAEVGAGANLGAGDDHRQLRRLPQAPDEDRAKVRESALTRCWSPR